jgi:hypothetical protein
MISSPTIDISFWGVVAFLTAPLVAVLVRGWFERHIYPRYSMRERRKIGCIALVVGLFVLFFALLPLAAILHSEVLMMAVIFFFPLIYFVSSDFMYWKPGISFLPYVLWSMGQKRLIVND